MNAVQLRNLLFLLNDFIEWARYSPLCCSMFTKWHVVFELIIFNENSYLNYNWENLFLKSTVSMPHPVLLTSIYFVVNKLRTV